jgi:hypothetical protein
MLTGITATWRPSESDAETSPVVTLVTVAVSWAFP